MSFKIKVDEGQPEKDREKHRESCEKIKRYLKLGDVGVGYIIIMSKIKKLLHPFLLLIKRSGSTV